jgi:hypothetical protein
LGIVEVQAFAAETADLEPGPDQEAKPPSIRASRSVVADRWERASKLSAEIATSNSFPKSQAEIDAAPHH